MAQNVLKLWKKDKINIHILNTLLSQTDRYTGTLNSGLVDITLDIYLYNNYLYIV